MSEYTTTYRTRYQIPSLLQQAEVAALHAAMDIFNEESSAPDHDARLAWANYCNANSSIATQAFMWAIGLNPSISGSIANDPSGASVPDTDVQFVVNSALPRVIDEYTKANAVTVTKI